MLAYYNTRMAVVICLAVIFAASSAMAEQLSLHQALDIAVKNNPTIAAAELSAQAANQSAKGARALKNPDIEIAPSIIGDAGADSAVLFSQPLELNGSRKVRGDIARYEAAAVNYDALATRRDLILQVSQTYWDIAQSQELVKLNQDNVRYLETIQTAVQKQYDVGSVPGAQVIKMDVELARARQELALAELELAQSKAELNILLNRPSCTDFDISDTLTFSKVTLNKESLQATALATRPEIASAQAQLLASQKQIKAAQLQKVPDVAIQARKESFSNDNDGGIALAVTLPILDWGSVKAEKESAATIAKSKEKQLEAVKYSVLLDVEKAIQRVNTAARIVSEYQGDILDKSEQLAAMAKKGYEKGASSYLELLEAQRTLRNTKSDYYSALAEYVKALAQLEWAISCPISTINSTEARK